MDVIAYLRVSTEEQARSGLGLEVQRSAITQAQRPDWTLRFLSDEGHTAANLDRPALTEALAALRSGAAGALVVSKLDRLSRSVLDFVTLCTRAKEEGWAIIALDVGVDMTTPQGQFVANVMASFAEMERELIRQRTRDSLAAMKAQGVRLGRPVTLDPAVRARIGRWREQGFSYEAIAGALNRDEVPTAQGGKKWYPAVVRGVVQSLVLDAEARATA